MELGLDRRHRAGQHCQRQRVRRSTINSSWLVPDSTPGGTDHLQDAYLLPPELFDPTVSVYPAAANTIGGNISSGAAATSWPM
jgi:hypothetical protein